MNGLCIYEQKYKCEASNLSENPNYIQPTPTHKMNQLKPSEITSTNQTSFHRNTSPVKDITKAPPINTNASSHKFQQPTSLQKYSQSEPAHQNVLPRNSSNKQPPSIGEFSETTVYDCHQPHPSTNGSVVHPLLNLFTQLFKIHNANQCSNCKLFNFTRSPF